MTDASKDIRPADIDGFIAKRDSRKNHLLVIAIDHYDHFPSLYNAVRDADALVQLLCSKYQFDEVHAKLLFNQDATRRNIYEALEYLVRTVTPQDNLVLFFSGRGACSDTMEEGYWIPADAGREALYDYIPNVQIQQYLRRINSHHSFVIVDSCFSESLFTKRQLNPAGWPETVPSRWLLTSGYKGVVSEGKPGDPSPFVENILLFLKENRQPHLPIARLIEDVVYATPANAKQIPRGEPIEDTGHKGGQFFFKLSEPEAVDWAIAGEEGTVESYTRFLTLYPEGRFHLLAKLALLKAKEEKAWQEASMINAIPAFYGFEKRFMLRPLAHDSFNEVANIEEEMLWNEALQSNTIAGYKRYVQRSVLKQYHSEALDKIRKLSDPGGCEMQTSQARRESALLHLEQERKASEARTTQRLLEEETSKIKTAERGNIANEQQAPSITTDRPNTTKVVFNMAALVLSAFLIGIMGWQMIKLSESQAVWICENHYSQCWKQGDYYMVKEDQLWGYVDSSGSIRIAPRFEEANPFDVNGLALVKEYGKFGWIDGNGDARIPFVYDKANLFSDGLAEVIKDGKVFYIDTSGQIAVDFITDSLAGNFIFVKGGAFNMGCTEEQRDCDNDEKPVRMVTLGDYYIGETEVTQAQWRAVMGSDPPELHFKGCDQCPVEGVSWDEVQEFIRRLNNRRNAIRYRLPTEAEWEYAARGGLKTQGYLYAGSNILDEVAWYGFNSEDKPRPVHGKKPNELGLYDMSGNVWEWCSDWYNPYPRGSQRNPPGPSLGTGRVDRGGSWENEPVFCRVATRSHYTPISPYFGLGFRLAKSP